MSTNVPRATHSNATFFQFLEDSSDGYREGEGQLAATLLWVGWGDDVDVGLVRVGLIPDVVMFD